MYRLLEAFNKEKLDTASNNNQFNYMQVGDAKIRARFVDHLTTVDEDLKILIQDAKKLIDLCYGSGSLTAAIVGETNHTLEKIVVNDKYKEDANVDIKSAIENIDPKIKVTPTGYDFFKENEFKKIAYDLVVFNPTYGSVPKKKDFTKGKYENLKSTINKISGDTSVIFFNSRKEEDYKDFFSKYSTTYELWSADGFNFIVGYKSTDGEASRTCYEFVDGNYVIIPDCKKAKTQTTQTKDLNEIENQIEEELDSMEVAQNPESPIQSKSSLEIKEDTEEIVELSQEEKGNFDFQYKNILLKGVPGTGKSRQIDIWVVEKLGLEKNDKNVLRINIHSASSNADLMQGIGINTRDGAVEYSEKKGLILKHITKAILHPNQPFAIILEEIQENSLNELIGDLIYLIESTKRINIGQLLKEEKIKIDSVTGIKFSVLINTILEASKGEYVELPKLLSTSNSSNKMILPDNLYIFCTSNYRDDKKVIEDNLLRRFEVIEIYPKDKVKIGEAYKNQEVSNFVTELNQAILKEFNEIEIHPDRFLIGHAIWLAVEDQSSFCRAMLKVITEFKDIKELEYNGEVRKILSDLTYPFGYKLPGQTGYMPLIEDLQAKGFKGIIE